ncbi:MAG: helix-turn-helix domain-containing protein [Micrococcales bacterium]|nr:helix-turn-helix domain-containing protein [Micrococcales bacterium]
MARHESRSGHEQKWCGNGAEAARRYFIHYNTLKHRLAHISSILGRDLREPRERTTLALALAALAARRVVRFGE